MNVDATPGKFRSQSIREDLHVAGENNEIGVSIHHNFRSKGYGRKSVKRLMAMHVRRKWFANIAPDNHASQSMFALLGFRQLQQVWVKDE